MKGKPKLWFKIASWYFFFFLEAENENCRLWRVSQRVEGKEIHCFSSMALQEHFSSNAPPFTDKALLGPARVIGLDAIKLFSYVTNNQRWCLIPPDARYLWICNRHKWYSLGRSFEREATGKINRIQQDVFFSAQPTFRENAEGPGLL